MKNYYIYILKCLDNSYYTGVTSDLEKRLHEHQFGLDEHSYTYKRRPVSLQYAAEFQDVNEAIAREKQIKGWSRAKKKALIAEDFNKLITLAKCHPDIKSVSP